MQYEIFAEVKINFSVFLYIQWSKYDNNINQCLVGIITVINSKHEIGISLLVISLIARQT